MGLGVGLLATSGWLWAACLRATAVCPFLLAGYLAAWAGLVLSVLALSALDAFARPGLVACLVLWLGAAFVAWVLRGRPRAPQLRPRLRWLAGTLRAPELAVLAVPLALGYAYLLALGLFTPQNDGDPLVYQLTRAALWRQEQSLVLADVPQELRLDVNPIVAEAGQSATLVLAGSERFVWLVQLPAAAALAVGAFAIARRAGFSPRQALFGALLVPALPVVAVQAITGFNDVLVASFVVAAAVFVLGRGLSELVPFGLAIALALGTKFSAPFVLPVVVLAGAVAQPVRRWGAFALAGGLGAVAGSGWYVVNVERTGELDGGLAAFGEQETVRSIPVVFSNAQRLFLASFERPGTAGLAVLAFVAVGVATTVVVGARSRLGWRRAVLAGGLVAAAPFAASGVSRALALGFAAFWQARGNADLEFEARAFRAATTPDGVLSWYGPVATAVGLAAAVIALRRRRAAPPLVLALTLAPWLALLVVAITVAYDPFRGRFLLAAWVLGVATWGLLAHRAWAAYPIALVSALTFVLCLVQYQSKPAGIDVLSDQAGPPIWSRSRWEAQTQLRGTDREDGEKAVLRAVEKHVPGRAAIAVSVAGNDFLFPYFGASLDRKVTVLGLRDRVPPAADWLAAAPEAQPTGCAEAFRRVVTDASGWRLYRRAIPDACDSAVTLASDTSNVP